VPHIASVKRPGSLNVQLWFRRNDNKGARVAVGGCDCARAADGGRAAEVSSRHKSSAMMGARLDGVVVALLGSDAERPREAASPLPSTAEDPPPVAASDGT